MDPLTVWMLKVAAVLAIIAAVFLAFGLVADDASAAKPDPWHLAPSPAQEFTAVRAFVESVVPPGKCGADVAVSVADNPLMPAAYVSAGAVGDRDVAAGEPVNGYYLPEDCTIVVRRGTPMEMCDRFAHEKHHDQGYHHGDDIPSMNAGGVEPACHASPVIRSMERYHDAFDSVGAGVRCRARGEVVECSLSRRISYSLNFRGVTF